MANFSSESAMSPRSPSGLISPRPGRSRAQSLSSDRPSTVAHSLMSAPLQVSPEAAFIAAAAASQIVTNDHDAHADTWYDQQGIEPAGETALVSAGALQLVNSFLDQLLFNFLQCARATTLTALRPAVSEVLKPKLAKDAIGNADEELQEYLGGGDEDDYVQPQGASSRDWDLELVWKRTRLRCMVYSSLGDMEEEDEDLWMEQENLEIGADEQISDVISPAVAIFLTSVLEYMGELTLTVAGQAAHHRMRSKFEKDLKDGTKTLADIADRIVVDDMDMERVALDRTLGRLWRGWKKRIRTPGTQELNIRPYSRNSIEPSTPRLGPNESKSPELVERAIAEDVEPHEVPLPMGDRDVDEIEVPGLVHYSDEEEEGELEQEEFDTWRPKSLLITPAMMSNGLPTPSMSPKPTPILLSRTRSNSLPTPGTLPFYAAPKYAKKELVTEQENKEGSEEVEKTVADEEVSETAERKASPNDDDNSKDETTPTPKRLSQVTAVAISAAAAASAGITAALVGTAAETGTHNTDDSEDDRPMVDAKEEIEHEDAATALGHTEVATKPSVKHEADSISSTHKSPEPEPAEQPFVGATVNPGEMSAFEAEMSLHRDEIAVPAPERASLAKQQKPSDVRSSSLDENEVASSTEAVRKTAIKDHRVEDNTALSTQGSKTSVDKKRQMFETLRTTSEPAEQGKEGEAVEDRATSTKIIDEDDQRASVETGPPPPPPITSNGSARTSVGTKVTIFPSPSVIPTEDNPPEVPRKAANRHNAKREGAGLAVLERIQTRESTDDVPSPISPRQIHTSGSSQSSGTNRMKAVRTSEENGHRENVARNFEELIQSNETITYTLTPENMRDIDPKTPGLDSPVVAKFGRKSEDSRGHNRSPSSGDTKRPSSRTSALTSPFRDTFMSSGSLDRTSSKRNRSTSIAGPREARVPEGSVADFADFIKSTGPTKDNLPSPLRNVGLGAGATSAATPDSPSFNTASARLSTASRNRYQPREAGGDTRGDNSDLIDFIRQGPPTGPGSTRIPHHVAPFNAASGADHVGAGLEASDAQARRQRGSVTDNSMASMQSSTNSKTALLKNGGSNTTPTVSFDEDDMRPQRKSRKPRDPYAIDLSDEEDMTPQRKSRKPKDAYEIDMSDEDNELMFEMVKAPTKKEESLAEFLRDYNPPRSNQAGNKPPSPPKGPKKKSSAPTLMGRFSRNGRDSPSISSPVMSPTETRSVNSRQGSRPKYVPIQVNIPAGAGESYTLPADSFSRPRVPSGSSGRVPMKKFEPRDAIPSSVRTTDLASFLRNTPPPPSNGMTSTLMTPVPEEAPSSTVSKLFGRRKK